MNWRDHQGFPLAISWLLHMATCNEAFVLVWDAQRVARGIPSIFA